MNEKRDLEEHVIALIDEIHARGSPARINTNELRCVWDDQEIFANTPYRRQIVEVIFLSVLAIPVALSPA